MRKVIVESPFAPKGTNPISRALDGWHKRRYLRACMRDCLLRNEAPYASHGLYTQAGVLDDTIPEERDYRIKAGFEWRERADATVVYLDLGRSTGMEYGIKHAKKLNHNIDYRYLAWRPYSSLRKLAVLNMHAFWEKTKGFFTL